MGEEREVKLLLVNYEVAREALLETGFKYIDTCFEEDYYYSHPCIDFSVTDEALRARRRKCSNAEYYTITYKGPRVVKDLGLKTRVELEVELTNVQWNVIRSIIEKLGFTSVARVSKTRDLYTTECVDAYLDELHGVGFYLELELKCDRGEEHIKRVIERLGGGAQVIHETYLEICLKTRKCA